MAGASLRSASIGRYHRSGFDRGPGLAVLRCNNLGESKIGWHLLCGVKHYIRGLAESAIMAATKITIELPKWGATNAEGRRLSSLPGIRSFPIGETLQNEIQEREYRANWDSTEPVRENNLPN
jgi:hypothetical protein